MTAEPKKKSMLQNKLTSAREKKIAEQEPSIKFTTQNQIEIISRNLNMRNDQVCSSFIVLTYVVENDEQQIKLFV